MARRVTTLVLPVALVALALAGCGSEKPSNDVTSPSPSSTSATPTPSVSRTATPSAAAAAAPEETEEPVTEDTAPAQANAAAGDGEVQQFFQTGGQCVSDVWSSSMPHTDALQQKVIDYCAANQLGDWAHGVDPMDPKNYGGGNGESNAPTYEKPDADANGYVGPSDEYYDYDGYVAPGFEYQVGSECFDPGLGRCKTSGEIQSENLEQ